MSRQRFIRHLILPSIAPDAMIRHFFTPITAFDCANRGSMALAGVSVALVAGGATAIKGTS